MYAAMETEWMSNLPEELQNVPLYKLAIPGSHNSGAYSLSSELAPDAPGFVRTMCKLPGFGIFKAALRKWSECQSLCVKDQLHSGIRYLDLRISSKVDCHDFYLVHALYGPKVEDALREVNEFLETHIGEVVILDFNHFYQMDSEQHKKLTCLIKSILGSKLVMKTSMESLSLGNLRKNQKQAICIYQHEGESAGDDFLWPKECICAPWPNTKCPDTCMKKLTKYMQSASDLSPNMFVVCQGILTPDTKYALSHLRGGGVHKITQQLRPRFLSWIKRAPSCWSHQPSIVIHDFVDEDNYIQCILELNKYRKNQTQTTASERGDSIG